MNCGAGKVSYGKTLTLGSRGGGPWSDRYLVEGLQPCTETDGGRG